MVFWISSTVFINKTGAGYSLVVLKLLQTLALVFHLLRKFQDVAAALQRLGCKIEQHGTPCAGWVHGWELGPEIPFPKKPSAVGEIAVDFWC